MGKVKDLTGKQFGEWSAIQFESVKGRSHWWCKCSCGSVHRVATSNLTSGKTQCCRDCYMPEQTSVGTKFGEWLVLGPGDRKGTRNQLTYRCKCSCGEIKDILVNDLRRGKSTKCKKCTRTHGMSKHPLYRVWVNMKVRCDDEGSQSFHNYGGRGITICAEWYSYECFRDDMFESYVEHKRTHKGNQNTSLDRTDNDGNYCKNNCCWATAREQRINQRKLRKVQVTAPDGSTETFKSASECIRQAGFTKDSVYKCLNGSYAHHKKHTFEYIA